MQHILRLHIKKKVILCLVCILCMSGCASKQSISEMNTAGSEENPFEDIQGTNDLDYFFSIKYLDYDENNTDVYLDENGKLPLNVEIKNYSSEIEVGLVFFVDGIPQSYEVDGESYDLYPVTVGENETKDVSVSIDVEYGIEGSRHYIYGATVLFPFYQTKNHGVGHEYGINEFLPLYLNAEATNVVKNEMFHIDYSEISEETRKEYEVSSSMGTSINRLENNLIEKIDQKETTEEMECIHVDESAEITLLGGAATNYGMAVLSRGKYINCFNGLRYTDISLNPDQMAKFQWNAPTEYDCEVGDIMLLIVCPSKNEGGQEFGFSVKNVVIE